MEVKVNRTTVALIAASVVIVVVVGLQSCGTLGVTTPAAAAANCPSSKAVHEANPAQAKRAGVLDLLRMPGGVLQAIAGEHLYPSPAPAPSIAGCSIRAGG